MIDLGVMNDFADDEQPAIFENLARGVSKIDRALDAVAKTKLLGQAHGRIADRNDSAGASYFFDDIAAIMRFDLLLHRRHHVRRAQIHLLARRRAAGNQVCAHAQIVILSVAKNLGSFALTSAQNTCQRCFALLNMTH